MKKERPVLVTGATGFVGAELAAHLRRSAGRAVVGLSRTRGARSFVRCDVSNAAAVSRVIRRLRPAVVYHCAGATAPAEWEHLSKANIGGTYGLMEGILAAGKPYPRVVVVGSAAEYGAVRGRVEIGESMPAGALGPYGVSKLCQSRLALLYGKYGIPVVVARLFNLFGPRMPEHMAVGRFLRLIAGTRSGGEIHVAPLGDIRDFLPLSEACAGLVAVGRSGKPGETYNVCSGRGVRMRVLLRHMIRLARRRLRVVEDRARIGANSWSVGDPSKTRRHTGWRAGRDWRAGLADLMGGMPGGAGR